MLQCSSFSWGAAVPAKEQISYSQTTTLAAGTYTMRFSLWDSATVGAGTMVWSEEKTITVPSTKTITTNLGTVTPLTTVDFSKQYWVQVDVDNGGVYTMVGTARTAFRMVPYAEFALDIDDGAVTNAKIADASVTNVKIATGAVKAANIASSAVTSGKIANGAVTATKLASFCPDGQYMKYTTATGWGCSVGTPGATGPTGPTGPQGVAGPTGATGAQGVAGITGPTGATGAQGLQGLTGAAGATGATGAQGLQGLTGATGLDGPKGDKGVIWRGAWDNGSTYTVDDAVSYQGSSYIAIADSVGWSGLEPATDPDAWHLMASKGDTGPQGLQGLTGATGATGATGPQGIQGPTGATGPSGTSSWTDGTGKVTTANNVGIGTSTPSQKLDVIGNIKASGSVTATSFSCSGCTESVVIPGWAFNKFYDVYGGASALNYSTKFYRNAGTNSAEYMALLDIPNGSTITGVTLRYYDNDPSNPLQFGLASQDLTDAYRDMVYSFVSSTPSTAVQTDVHSGLSTVVDRTTKSYSVWASVPSSTELGITSVTVSYTKP